MKFIDRMKERSRLRRRAEGYEYAAGCLLKDGQAAIDMLESHVATMRDFGDYTPFDEGVEAAIKRYEEIVK